MEGVVRAINRINDLNYHGMLKKFIVEPTDGATICMYCGQNANTQILANAKPHVMAMFICKSCLNSLHNEVEEYL